MQTNKTDRLSTTICLVRHGETDWNLEGKLQGCEDIELNNKGRLQAFYTTEYFKNQKWDVIVSSPLKRAYETAQIISSVLSIPTLEIVDEFLERNYGKASGLYANEVAKRYPNGAIPGLEPFESLRQRALSGLTKIANEFQGKKIIVVSHGGLINSILYSLSRGAIGSFKTRLNNGSITKIEQEGTKWFIEFYNKPANELLAIKRPKKNKIADQEKTCQGLIGDIK